MQSELTKNLVENINPTSTTSGLFQIPIGVYNLGEDSHSLNNQLLDDIYSEKEVSEGITRSNAGGWHSDNKMESNYDSFRQLSSAINEMADHFVSSIGYKDGLYSRNFWANVNGPHQYNVPHHHRTDRLSGVYYPVESIVDGKRHFNYRSQDESINFSPGIGHTKSPGSLVFMDPSYGTKVLLKPKKDTVFTAGNVHLKPISGVLVLFPQYLLHYVTPFTEEKERVSISFQIHYR